MRLALRAALLAALLTAARAGTPDVYGIAPPSESGITFASPAASPAPAATPAPVATPPPAATALPEIPLGAILNGPPLITWKSLRGSVVLLDFFSFTCKPCLKAMPDIVRLQAAHPADLRVIGYHIGRGGPPEVAPLIQRFALNYPVIITPEATDPRVQVPGQAFLTQFGSELLPCAAVIARDGTLRAWNLPPDQVPAAVAKALAERR